jgi:hypothetical protein
MNLKSGNVAPHMEIGVVKKLKQNQYCPDNGKHPWRGEQSQIELVKVRSSG